MSSSLVSPEQRQDMACLRKLLEKAETNKTRMNIFLEIRFSNRCGFGTTILDAMIRFIDRENSIDRNLFIYHNDIQLKKLMYRKKIYRSQLTFLDEDK